MSRRRTIEHSHALLFVLAGLAFVAVLTMFGVLTVNVLQMNGSQWTLSFIIFFVVMIVGLALKLILDWTNAEGLITWPELIVGGLIVGILFSVVGVNIGWKLAYDAKISYNQNLNSWEASASANKNTCTKDGPCIHTYDCDPYIVMVPEPYDCGTTDNPETCTREVPETRYHSCPYVTTETTYVVTNLMGTGFDMGNACMPDNPDSHRWDPSEPVYVGGACVGVPPQWAAAKQRIDSGHPGPTTERGTYVNYVLASDTTILKQYSNQIDQLKKANLLPDLPHTVYNYYYEDRVSTVGFKPANIAEWQGVMAYFDGAFGNELHGDTYLVIVQSTILPTDAESYSNALKAYWTDSKVWDKDALPKNAVVVVVGTKDGKTVDWARATTGMPVGNNELATAIQNHMSGIPLTPESVLGLIDGQFYTKTKADGTQKLDVKGVGTDGFLRQTLWGLNDQTTKFCRVSMSGNSDCGTGFSYLKDQIRPSFDQQLTIVLTIFFLGIVLWLAEAFFVGDLRSSY